MTRKPKLSLMIHTASLDTFLESQGIKSYFQAVCRNLCEQKFRSIEFIYVDTFYENNKIKFDSIVKKMPFTVKHVPIHKNHRYFYDKGHTYISAAKNTGILYADGELLVTCDDAEFFPNQLFELYWKHYQNGHYMLGVHNRLKTIATYGGLPKFPIQGDVYINDHRIKSMQSEKNFHSNGSWAFAGTSFSLDDAIKLNGFNERMDGCKSLEDCEFGTRLELLNRKFVCDKKGFFYILDHQSYSVKVPTKEFCGDGQVSDSECKMPLKKHIENLVAIENYGVLSCTKEFKEIVANHSDITEKHWEIIQRETKKYRKFDPLSEENKDNLEIWKNVPKFNIKKEREELRKSSEWKWNI